MRNCSTPARAPRFRRSSPRRSGVVWHTTYRRSFGRACTGRERGIAPRAEAARLPVSESRSPRGGNPSTRACHLVELRERSVAHAMLSCLCLRSGHRWNIHVPFTVWFASLSCRHPFLVRDVGALSEAAAERNVLARRFVERDQEIVRGDLRGRDDGVVQGLQQTQSLLLRTARDE